MALPLSPIAIRDLLRMSVSASPATHKSGSAKGPYAMLVSNARNMMDEWGPDDTTTISSFYSDGGSVDGPHHAAAVGREKYESESSLS